MRQHPWVSARPPRVSSPLSHPAYPCSSPPGRLTILIRFISDTSTGLLVRSIPFLPSSPHNEYHIEGLIIAATMMAVSGYFGPSIWHEPLAATIGYPNLFKDYSLLDIWIPMLIILLTAGHIPACVYNVAKARRARNLPLAPVFLEWTPFFVFALATGSWLYSPHSTLMRENRLMLFCLTMSFVFGRMTTKIILAHLTRQPFPYWTVMLVPLIGGSVLGNLPLLGFKAVSVSVELWYLRAYFVFAMIAYFRWAVLVINSICAYLDINCLTITPRLLPPSARNSMQGKSQKVGGTNEPMRRSARISANGFAKGE